ncbi:hypothetical protein [Paraburkholderia caledonica]|uniref:Secreted protein n=1 Tax=Paraburkholderia caledonica TaxID=134536 RepID=A0AB73IR27_9BURK|nr:hypothetical protein [Paraburkholderia caledonica]
MRDSTKSAGMVALVVLVGVGASLTTVLAMRDTPLQSLHSSTLVPNRISTKLGRDSANVFHAVSHVTEAPPLDRTMGASAAYDQALRYIVCQTRAAEPPPNASTPDETYQVDPTGKFAARLAQESVESDMRCRHVGPAEYRQIEPLLEVAAAEGNLDARSTLLRRRANALIGDTQRSESGALTRDSIHVDLHEAHAIVTGLEQLALSGHHDSIVALEQLLASSAMPSIDPVEAAAWRLVSLQVPGAPFPEEAKLQGRLEVLDEMDDATRETVLARARALFAQCCEH